MRNRQAGQQARVETFTALALAAALTLAVADAAPAQQQQNCPDGVTGSGTCVKSGVANALRQRTVILSQPTLSWTGLPQAQDVPSTLNPGRDRQQSLKDQLTATAPAVSGGSSSTAATSGVFVPLPAGVNPSSLNIPGGFTVVPGGIRLK